MKNKILIMLSSFLFLAGCFYPEPKVVFDIPSLIGKNIDEVTYILGNNYSDHDPFKNQKGVLKTRGSHSYRIYEKFRGDSTISLSICYIPYTKEIKFLTIVSRQEYKSKADILKLGNLDSLAGDYVLEYDTLTFFLGNRYTNIRVYPNK
ncbi:hypothetical protein [Pedobacter glucosidilyticus]|uniref:hypothetical protein n=1 Tax=Pedobacter glucosidilyticus TaxID=1122941 RepID=UPI0012DD9378|nr:hypothetical protein [Pedobacter glucosidilyticus]